MTAMRTAGERQHAAPAGSRVAGTSPGHNLKRAVHGSVSASCPARLPGRVTVIAADPPGHGPGQPARAGTGAGRTGPATRAVRW